MIVNVVTSATTDFIYSWLNTPSTTWPFIKGVQDVIPEDTTNVAFLISGYTADTSGMYNFVVDWSLFKPDSSIMFDQKKFAVGHGPMPDKPSFVIADPVLYIILEKSDPLGTYEIVATVHDLNTNKKAIGRYKIILVKP